MTEVSLRDRISDASSMPASLRRSGKKPPNFLPLAFLLPTIAVLLALQFFPALYSLYLSLGRIRRREYAFVGLRNFERLLQSPSFIEGLQHTLTFSFWVITVSVLLGLLLALLFNRRVKYTGGYLALIFIPWVLSDVVAGTMWRWLFQPSYGLLQQFVTDMMPWLGINFYTHPQGSMFIVILATIWQGLAFTTILSLGALQIVPKENLEAAQIDGAGRFQSFFYVTLPLIRPTLLVMILLVSIRAINSAGLIFATTGGGPGRATQTAAIYLLITGWQQGQFGAGAAVSVLLLILNIIMTMVYLSLIGRKTENN